MKAGEVCINDIFNGARLIEVPFYQRAYVWKEEQWERFLTDMEYVSDTQRHYFLGSIILKNGETPNMTDAFSSRKIIIDGQQRLTTLILFFKVLCLKVGCNGYFDHDFRFSNGDIAMQHSRNDSAAFNLVTSQNTAGEIKNTTRRRPLLRLTISLCRRLILQGSILTLSSRMFSLSLLTW